jgi:site-specific recombinase XerD
VAGFDELLNRFERNISVLGRSQSTFNCYSRHIAAMAMHFGCLPTELDSEQVQDYLYLLQSRSKTPSQTYFKHTVYGLRFLLKGEGLEYSFLHLPSIKHEKKLPVVLSKAETWRLLQKATLLKHKMLLGLMYGCGLRCIEVRNIRLQDIDFDRKMLHIVQSKGKKDRYVPLSSHIIRGLQKYIAAERPVDWLFNGQPSGYQGRAGGDFDSRYSNRGINWVVTSVAKAAGISKKISAHSLRHTYATHLLEDGLDIITLKDLLGHERIETTMEYLHICQLDRNRAFSPLDTLFAQCAPAAK